MLQKRTSMTSDYSKMGDSRIAGRHQKRSSSVEGRLIKNPFIKDDRQVSDTKIPAENCSIATIH
jgi:hypothetical protein